MDISTKCTFLLDYEEEEEEESSGRQKKKPWRYRWSEEVHDEVLAQLLQLNQQRAEAEILGGVADQTKAKGNTKKVAKSRKAVSKMSLSQNFFNLHYINYAVYSRTY